MYFHHYPSNGHSGKEQAIGWEQRFSDYGLLSHWLRIEDAQLFLIPLDAQRSWYRYHDLFRQMLLSRQRFYNHPDQIAPYRRRAAVRFACHGECPKNRFISAPVNGAAVNSLP